MHENRIPKVFISYSWVNKGFALMLAERLRNDGVDAIIDEWNLDPGHDKYKFMEQCVVDQEIIKVLLLLDKNYTDKANSRNGGVGDETQIISPEVYADASQSKFIPVVIEKDEKGEPYLPAYLKSRIYIDLSDDDKFEDEYKKLLRNIYNRPEHIKPPLGERPRWLDGDSLTLYQLNILNSKLEKLNNPRQIINHVDIFADEYIKQIASYLKSNTNVPSDIYKLFLDMKTIRDCFLTFIAKLYIADENFPETICTTIEKIYNSVLDVESSRENGIQLTSANVDLFKTHIWELFILLITFLLYKEDFKAIANILSRTFFLKGHFSHEAVSPNDYRKFYNYGSIIEDEYKSNSGYKNHYTLIGEMVCKFRELRPIYTGKRIAEADLFLFQVYPAFSRFSLEYNAWYPKCYIYSSEYDSIWIKLKSKQYCCKIFALFGISSLDELKALLIKCSSQKELRYGNCFKTSLNILRFIKLEEIGTFE